MLTPRQMAQLIEHYEEAKNSVADGREHFLLFFVR